MIYDDVVVGAGIVGLAHAYQLGRRGRRVCVLEKGMRASGASIRNFGLIWPIGQAMGERRQLAMRSRDYWVTVLNQAKIPFDASGSLHVARADDEAAVLHEMLERADANDVRVSWLDAAAVVERSPRVRREGLQGALFSPSEICVDARQVVGDLPDYLHRTFGVHFRFGCEALSVDDGIVRTGSGDFRAEKVFVCPGAQISGVAAPYLRDARLIPCKLQMMRSAPLASGERLGPSLAAGLTFAHYDAFADCPTRSTLVARLDREFPECRRWGIHVMVSQNNAGELLIGDSHQYGDEAHEPFDSVAIDRLILNYLDGYFELSGVELSEHWHGVYTKHPERPYVSVDIDRCVHVVTGFGGAGMTLSFGVAEKVVSRALGEDIQGP